MWENQERKISENRQSNQLLLLIAAYKKKWKGIVSIQAVMLISLETASFKPHQLI